MAWLRRRTRSTAWLRRKTIGVVAKVEGKIGGLWLRRKVRLVAWGSRLVAWGGRSIVAEEERVREEDSERSLRSNRQGERARERYEER